MENLEEIFNQKSLSPNINNELQENKFKINPSYDLDEDDKNLIEIFSQYKNKSNK